MAWATSIRIVDNTGTPIRNVKVVMFPFGVFGGVMTSHTSADGWADFELDIEKLEINIEKIYANSKLVEKLVNISNGQKFSFTI